MNSCFKGLIAACVAVAVASPLAAYAQANDLPASQPFSMSQNSQVAQVPVSPSPSGSWQPQASTDLTRAQVYHDLVHAERDGQIKYLDQTIYAHH